MPSQKFHLVLLPYRFTLFSNERRSNFTIAFVLLPYRFTLFSNFHPVFGNCQMFYYLIDLHYSQTRKCFRLDKLWFYYLIDLHYSQTSGFSILTPKSFTTLQIYTILKLISVTLRTATVLLPYRFTLFSNQGGTRRHKNIVLLPYRFTLFSN